MELEMHSAHMPHDHGDIHKVLDVMPSSDDCIKAAETFKQLCDGTRLQILWLLCHSEECVVNIAAAIGMSAPAVSHHLRFLKQAELIKARRIGKEVHYSLEDTEEAVLVHHMIDELFKIQCPKGEFHEHTD
ncbi:MAG: ArsR/SmtB family transcription factor [Lachnospiraceae bacterium]